MTGPSRDEPEPEPEPEPTEDMPLPPGVTAVGKGDLPDVPGYEVLGEIGRGGMGVVYLARNVRLNRTCALKMILAGAASGPIGAARFLAEAAAIARIQHPHIVQIRHCGEAGLLPFLELELLEGGSLDARLDGKPWEARRAAALIEPLARALAAAHREKIVHRDLKPANILLAADGTPKVADFGIAKGLDDAANLTATELIIGTPGYMAPEQAAGDGRAVGPAADQYSLGAIFYELLTGRPPFRGTGLLDTLQQVRDADPVPVNRLVPGVNRDVETIALKCLRKEPGKRYASAEALANDLRRFLDGHPIEARPTGPAERLWLWCRRNPTIAGLAAAAAALVLLLVAGSTAAALVMGRQNADLRAEKARSSRAETLRKLARVDSLMAAAPEGVPYLLERLGEDPALVRPALHRWLEAPDTTPLKRLRAAEALTILGEPQPGPLLEALPRAPVAEAGGLVEALKALGPPAHAGLDRLAVAERDPGVRARLAVTALLLGRPGPARAMLAAGPDPADRVVFQQVFASWRGDASALPALLEAEADLHVRSGLFVALGGLDPRGLNPGGRASLVALLERSYLDAPDAETHSAAGYALRRWGLTPPAIATAPGPGPGRHWFINRAGLTMLELPKGTFRLERWEQRAARTAEVRSGAYLSDREVSVALYQQFCADPAVPGRERPSPWQRPSLAVSPADDCPATGLSWWDAVLFCNWLSRRDGRQPLAIPPSAPGRTWTYREDGDGYRLPDYVSWEYADRAGSVTAYPVGETATYLSARGVIAQGRLEPGGGRPPNLWGFFDLFGNAWEYCTISPPDEPWIAIRGGAFDSGTHDCKSGELRLFKENGQGPSIGFRVLCPGPHPGPGPAGGQAATVSQGLDKVFLPAQAPLLGRYAEEHALKGRWDAAAADLAEQARLAPNDFMAGLRGAVAELMAGRREAYLATCQGVIHRFGTAPEAVIRERAARTCLLSSTPTEVRDRAVQVVAELYRDDPQNAYLAWTAALAAYRAGHDPAAIALTDQCLKAADFLGEPTSLGYRAGALLIRALAETRMGRVDEARANLALAEAFLKRVAPDVAPPAPILIPWPDWAIAHLLRAEVLDELHRAEVPAAPADGP